MPVCPLSLPFSGTPLTGAGTGTNIPLYSLVLSNGGCEAKLHLSDGHFDIFASTFSLSETVLVRFRSRGRFLDTPLGAVEQLR